MPSKSKAQRNLMAAVAHNKAFAKKVGIPQSVGKDFNEADKGRKFGSGGRVDRQTVNKPKTDHGQQALFKKGGPTMAKKGLFGGKETYAEELKEAKAIKSGKITPKQYAQGEQKEEKTMKKMASGGITKAKMGAVKAGGNKPHGEHSVQTKGHTKGTQVKMSGSKPLGMKKGGKC